MTTNGSLGDLSLKTQNLSETTSQTKTEVDALPQHNISLGEANSSADTPKCIKCLSPARLKCIACSYDEERACERPIWYCRRDCQTADWNSHKRGCRSISNVNHLYRSARAIQKVFYAFRKNFFDVQITGVVVKGNKIVLTEGSYDERVTVPFPDHLISNESDKEAVLSHLACDDAVGRMHGLFENLLEGTYKDIKEFSVDLKHNLREVSIPSRSASPQFCFDGKPPVQCYHRLFKITLNTNIAYAIDLAGAQFGYHDPVSLWKDFQSTRVRDITHVDKFGVTKRAVNNLRENPLLMFCDPSTFAVQGNFRMVNEEMNSAFDSWASENGVTSATLARMGKVKHDALMSDMTNVLSSSFEGYGVKASKAKGFVVSIKKLPACKDHRDGRTMYVYGDGSEKDLRDVKKEGETPQWQNPPSKEEEYAFLSKEFPGLMEKLVMKKA